MTAAQPPSEEHVERHIRNWLEHAVIGLNLCPFARGPYVAGRVHLCIADVDSRDALLARVEREAHDLAGCASTLRETTLIVHPCVLQEFLDQHFFLEEVTALLKRLGLRGILQVVAFHPRYQFADSADEMDDYANRSPYPVLQLLREASVATAARQVDASVIYAANIERLRKLDPHAWERLVNEGASRDMTT